MTYADDARPVGQVVKIPGSSSPTHFPNEIAKTLRQGYCFKLRLNRGRGSATATGNWGRDAVLWLGRRAERLPLRKLAEFAGGLD